MFRPWASNVPAAISALVSALQLDMAVSFPAVVVKDGMFISAETNSDMVVVGWSGFVPGYQYPSRSVSEQLLQPVVKSVGFLEGLGPSVREEIEINCAAITRVGSDDLVDARTRAYNHVAVVGRMIAPPLSTLAGFLARTTMAQQLQLHQVHDRRGALAIVTFGIRGEAYAQQ